MNPSPPARRPPGTGPEPAAHRQARALLACAVGRLPEDRREWGEAMLAELDQITGRVRALAWAVGGFRVARLERRHHRQRQQGGPLMAGRARTTGWAAALLWALWAAMTTLLAFEFPTLAILLGLAGFMLARLLRLWPEGVAGTLVGAGMVCLLIGLLNLGGGRPCTSSTAASLSGILAAPAGQASSCGGIAPLPLLAAGSLLLAAGALLYWASARHAPR